MLNFSFPLDGWNNSPSRYQQKGGSGLGGGGGCLFKRKVVSLSVKVSLSKTPNPNYSRRACMADIAVGVWMSNTFNLEAPFKTPKVEWVEYGRVYYVWMGECQTTIVKRFTDPARVGGLPPGDSHAKNPRRGIDCF